jgi:uncharacterized membrane protein YfcA
MGGAAGALLVTRLPDQWFEQAFALLMLILLVPTLRPLRLERAGRTNPRYGAVEAAMLFIIGLYGGAFQAGVGLLLVMVLARIGHDLVVANSIKLVVVAAFTAVAVAIFLMHQSVMWIPALILAVSQAVGAAVGARIVVRGGERIVRPIFAVAVVVMAGRMLRLY